MLHTRPLALVSFIYHRRENATQNYVQPGLDDTYVAEKPPSKDHLPALRIRRPGGGGKKRLKPLRVEPPVGHLRVDLSCCQTALRPPACRSSLTTQTGASNSPHFVSLGNHLWRWLCFPLAKLQLDIGCPGDSVTRQAPSVAHSGLEPSVLVFHGEPHRTKNAIIDLQC